MGRWLFKKNGYKILDNFLKKIVEKKMILIYLLLIFYSTKSPVINTRAKRTQFSYNVVGCCIGIFYLQSIAFGGEYFGIIFHHL